MWQWSRVSKTRAERMAQQAAPPPDPTAYAVPGPLGRAAPYVPANFDYADNPASPNYQAATGGRRRWRTRMVDGEPRPSGDYPPAGFPPETYHGYRREDWQASERNEHLVNGAEGDPLFRNRRYAAALNPYFYRIPNSRIQRAPHEWDFRRPFDQQNVLGKRTFTGEHYSAANIGLTANPSSSLKGMSAPKRRRTTYRIEPIEYGDNIPATSNGGGPPADPFPSGSTFPGGSYLL